MPTHRRERHDGSRNWSAPGPRPVVFAELQARPDALAVLERELGALGLDGAALLRRAGLGGRSAVRVGEIVSGPAAPRLPVERLAAAYGAAVRATADPWLGLRLGAARGAAWLGPLGELLARAPTVFAAIEAARRFVPLLVAGQEVRTRRVGAGLRLQTSLPDGLDRAGADVILQSTVVLMANLVDELLLGPFLPLTLRFACRRPPAPETSALVARPGRSLRFGEDEWSLDLPASCLALPPRSADSAGHRRLHHHLEAERARLERAHGLLARLRLLLLTELAQRPRLASAARRLGMAPRTLQLHLAAHRTTFARQLAGVRIEVARRVLRDTDEPLAAVAARVGLGSAAAFSRFFRAETGQPPASLRASADGAGSARESR